MVRICAWMVAGRKALTKVITGLFVKYTYSATQLNEVIIYLCPSVVNYFFGVPYSGLQTAMRGKS